MKGKCFTFLVMIFFLIHPCFANEEGTSGGIVSKGDWAKKITADHSKFPSLDKDFDYAPDVTKACLGCHNQAGKQIHKTFHWKWKGKLPNGQVAGKGINLVNNFCGSSPSSEQKCASCHIGYNYDNKDFDFTSEENIDCLICHDTTATYVKHPTSAGHPVYEDEDGLKKVNLKKVAQNVGKPQRHNCLQCHAWGGGGHNVKHGDTDGSLINPSKELDVHMNADGANFSCQSCHTTSEHEIAGRYYDRPAFTDYKKNMNRRERMGKTITCEGCHGEKPHHDSRLNNHTNKVACTSCHIPHYARGGIPTKMTWDWSTGGLNTDGKLIKDHGGKPKKVDGHPWDYKAGKYDESKTVHTYQAIKGDFTWGVNVIPEYLWYKGELNHLTLKDSIDPTKPVTLNSSTGNYLDPVAKIWPFKIHRGKQPYDSGRNTLIPWKDFGPQGSGAFWSDFDWPAAIKAGVEYTGVPYSGKFGFIETEYLFPVKHMVAPEEQAVRCNECHSREGRLKNVPGFYLVGRDRSKPLDILGFFIIFGSLGGVSVHGLGRYINRNKKH